tara:strand:+ start:345 stop:1502 length:1158 start_codon:yes stop_codon:yes gene_type:complete
MVVRVSKPEFNLREKLTELDHPVGTHGSQIMKSRTISETANLVGVNRKNLLINGDFRINQRGGTKTHAGSSYNGFGVDMWYFHNSTNATYTSSVSSAAPNPPEVYHYLELACTVVDHSITSGQYASITTSIEGYNFQQSMFGTPHAKPLTLSFYHRHTVPGVYSGVLRTAAANFNYVFEYEQSTGDAWEKAVVYIKPEGTQAYALGTGKALSLTFSLADVTHLNDWVGQWFSHTYAHGSDRQINLFEDTSHKMRLTAIQLEVGSDATPFEQRSYQEELALCQRYYWQINDNEYRRICGYKRHDSNIHYEIQCPVPMRQAPAPTLSDGGLLTNFQGTFSATQSNPTIGEWNTATGQGLLVIESTYSSTHLVIPSWEGYQLQLSAEL